MYLVFTCLCNLQLILQRSQFLPSLANKKQEKNATNESNKTNYLIRYKLQLISKNLSAKKEFPKHSIGYAYIKNITHNKTNPL